MRRPLRGFTLIELLIVMAVVGIMGTLVSVQLTGADGRSRLRQGGDVVAADLRQVIEWSRAGKLVEDGDGLITPHGFGMYVTPDSSTADYVLFADVTGDGQYSPSSDVVMDRQQFVNDTVLSKVVLSGCSPQISSSCTLFVPVSGSGVTVNGALNTDLIINFEYADSPATLTLTLYGTTQRVEIE